ncbi:MAG: phosphotransferase [Arachnia sp.]
MSSPSVPLTGLLSGGAAWTTVDHGESRAMVLRHVSGDRFAKVVALVDASILAAERDRIEWLSDTGIPGPAVLDWCTTEHGACLVTSAVAGMSAERLEPAQLAQAWPSIAEALLRLHSIPASTCPYSRSLDEMMALARAVVAENRVHTEFLPRHLVDTPPAVILDSLERDLPRHKEHEETGSRYGVALDPDRLDFYLRLDPLTW